MTAVADATLSAWAERIKASDQTAFTDLYRALYLPLVRYAGRFVEAETAEDVVQEAFIRLWKQRETLDPGRSLRSYLYVVVRSRALNRVRNTTRRQQLLEEADTTMTTPTPDERTETAMLREQLRGWIDGLPGRQREAFQLSRFDGLSYQEIAQVMDVSVKTVEYHLHEALRRLRDHLRAYEPGLLSS